MREWTASTILLAGGDPRKDFTQRRLPRPSGCGNRWRSSLEPAGFDREAFVDVDRVLRQGDLALDHRGTPLGALHRRTSSGASRVAFRQSEPTP